MQVVSIKQFQRVCLEEGVTPSVLLEEVGFLEDILKTGLVSEESLQTIIKMYKGGFIRNNQVHNPYEDADTCGHDQLLAITN